MSGPVTRQSESLPSAKNKALGKEGFEFFLNILFVECLNRGTRQRHFEKKILCRASCQGHSVKYFPKKNLCRVPNSRHTAKKDVAEHRYAGQPMSSAALLPRAWHSAKNSFVESLFFTECPAECNFSSSAALGKEGLCRVPDFLHSAKQFALSKDPVSGSDPLTPQHRSRREHRVELRCEGGATMSSASAPCSALPQLNRNRCRLRLATVPTTSPWHQPISRLLSSAKTLTTLCTPSTSHTRCARRKDAYHEGVRPTPCNSHD